jgi:hypothetical protein
MADYLTSMWGKFTLTEEEEVVEEIPEEEISKIGVNGLTCLVGKLMANRIIGRDTIRTKMVRGWKPTKNVAFKTLGENVFLITFANPCD